MLYTPLMRTKNAIRFVNAEANAIWMVLGKTTPWTSPYSDASPPPDNPDAIAVTSPVIAIQATAIWAVENDSSGAYQFYDPSTNPPTLRAFSQVATEDEMITNLYNLVLITASMLGSSLINIGYNSFRQIGFSTDLVPAAGHTSDTILPAANVTDWGTIETLANRVPVSLISSTQYVLTELIQF